MHRRRCRAYHYQRLPKKCNGTKVEIKKDMDTPVPHKWLDEFLTIDEFRRAYESDGMKLEEFQNYGAFLRMINQFFGSYAGIAELVRDLHNLPIVDLQRASCV